MGTLKGKNLMVSVNGTIYGFATTCNFKSSVDLKEIASGDYKHAEATGQSVEYEASRLRWEITSSHICDAGLKDGLSLFKIMAAGKPIDVSFEKVSKKSTSDDKLAGETGTLEATEAIGFYGKALIESLEISGEQDGDATYSITLRGTGPVSNEKPE